MRLSCGPCQSPAWQNEITLGNTTGRILGFVMEKIEDKIILSSSSDIRKKTQVNLDLG